MDLQAMRNLKRYVYFRCLSELEEQLSAAAPGTSSNPFERIFLELSQRDVRVGWAQPTPTLPEGMEHRNEKCLIDLIYNSSQSGNTPLSKEQMAHRVTPDEQLRIRHGRTALSWASCGLLWRRFALILLSSRR